MRIQAIKKYKIIYSRFNNGFIPDIIYYLMSAYWAKVPIKIITSPSKINTFD